ncbi:hypothetical protein [Bradyrhizobium ganzhouense]|uniref:hypothetical protein n=1 Tax=Bradyrhizobium ganzhouense TaxID=1179767 RepID=UPI003CEC8F78
MSEPPQIIATIEDACSFIADWFGLKDDPAGSPIALPFEMPQAIQVVNRRLGRLWLEHGNVRIFDSQDTLISPHRYEVQPDGIVPVILENQGVWACGFKPETGAQLWVTGDWPGDQVGSNAWRLTQDVVDTAIVFVMLANAVWTSAGCQLDENEKATEFRRRLWTFAPWTGFSGFWTNEDRTLMRMQGSGWGVSAHR